MSGDELKRWRQDRALSQRELAGLLGVGVRTVWQWEHLERIPMGELLRWALIGLECARSHNLDVNVSENKRFEQMLPLVPKG